MSMDADALIRTFMAEVWDGNDPDAADRFLTPDYVDNTYPGGTIEGLKAQVRLLHGAFSDARQPIDDLLVDGDRVMLRGRLTGTHTGPFRHIEPSGASVDVRVVRWFRLADGRIAEHWGLLDTAGLMSQIGAAAA